LRPATPEDEAFLRVLYGSTRTAELESARLTAAQQDALIGLQFKAQGLAYGEQYPEADHQIILVDGQPAGRLLVNRSRLEIRLVDISLLSEHRNRGIGASFIRGLQTEAETAGTPLTLHVSMLNPAIRLYQRLGFVQTGETGSHLQMEWRAASMTTEARSSCRPAQTDPASADTNANSARNE
jgi:ribosomal protein S18 acetylase RimI-like enzyme